MALNWQTFRTRALTAIIFVIVMMAGLLWNQWSFLILFSIIHFGCWWEYLQLLEKIYKTSFHNYTKLGFLLLGYGVMLLFCNNFYQVNNYTLKDNLSLPFSAAGIGLLIAGIFQKNKVDIKAFGIAALGLLYISVSWGFMLSFYKMIDIHIHDTMYVMPANFLPLVIIASIWINDTMAYIVGSMIGKTPLSKISPKKTWEGTAGGVILCVVVVSLLFYMLYLKNMIDSPIPMLIVIAIIALVAAVMGTLGDLLESKLKRMADVKDSGSFMPGHGGFLDRFDSLLIANLSIGLLVTVFSLLR